MIRSRWFLARATASFLVCLALGAQAATATERGEPIAEESLALCKQADELPGVERERQLARALELAERAVSLHAQDARAHLAVFCNLGKHLQAGRGVAGVFTLGRLRHEIDRSLELAPNDADALAAKGAFLLELPRLLGGDPSEAERLLRAALDANPLNGVTRRYLAEALRSRGADDEARAVLQSLS
jgi:hypothetical protein